MNTARLARKFKELQQARPLPLAVLANLDAWLRVELTYTSNAIEGNTLTRAETAIVLEKGLTIAGKPLKDHLEASNHAAAYDWIKTLVKKKPHDIDGSVILKVHGMVLKGIDDENAGHYRRVPVRIAGSSALMPNAAKVPALMQAFAGWLAGKPKLHPAELAAQAHYRLVTIHPFSDGNGRTARLLMNLVLIQSGYPPAIIRTQDRAFYINSLEQAQTGGALDDFEELIGKAVERSLDLYLKALHEEEAPVRLDARQGKLLKIGELAKQAGESVPTIRFWVKEGLIDVARRTRAGYQLFDKTMLARAKHIRALQEKRLSLEEVRKKLATD